MAHSKSSGSPGPTKSPPGELKLFKTKPPELSRRDHLLMLLSLATEFEHSLMVQYLYAAYSLGGPQVPPEHRERVASWQNQILTIAREEMGHLLCVLNLSSLLGGMVRLERSNFPWDSFYNPFPFRLEPLTLESLSCYVYAEKPSDHELYFAQEKKFSKDRRYEHNYERIEKKEMARIIKVVEKLFEAREDQRRGSSGSATGKNKRHTRRPEGHPVSELYHDIIAIVSDPTWVADADFRAETLHQQGSWDDWGKSYKPEDKWVDAAGTADPSEKRPVAADRVAHVIVKQIATRTEAIAALKAVAGQGEAPQHGDARSRKEPSHFDRFLAIYQDFEKHVKGWSPTHNVAANPTTKPPQQGSAIAPDTSTAKRTQRRDDAVPQNSQPYFIQNTHSRGWANLFNLRYRMLLMYLTHVYRLTSGRRGDPNLRGMVIHRIFGEMYNIKTIASILVTMPLMEDETNPLRAGPPFEMPYSVTLPVAEVDAWRLHREILLSADDLIQYMLRTETQQEHPDHVRYLLSLRDSDLRAREWADRVIAGKAASERAAAGGRIQ